MLFAFFRQKNLAFARLGLVWCFFDVSNKGGFSTIIDNFIIGGVDIGKTRITVAEVSLEFKNIIMLGMNVLVWFNMLVSHSKKEITLSERRIKGLDKSNRFYRTDIFSRNVLASITEYED